MLIGSALRGLSVEVAVEVGRADADLAADADCWEFAAVDGPVDGLPGDGCEFCHLGW